MDPISPDANNIGDAETVVHSTDLIDEYEHTETVRVYDQNGDYYVEYTLASNHPEEVELNLATLRNSMIEVLDKEDYNSEGDAGNSNTDAPKPELMDGDPAQILDDQKIENALIIEYTDINIGDHAGFRLIEKPGSSRAINIGVPLQSSTGSVAFVLPVWTHQEWDGYFFQDFTSYGVANYGANPFWIFRYVDNGTGGRTLVTSAYTISGQTHNFLPGANPIPDLVWLVEASGASNPLISAIVWIRYGS